LPGKRKKHKLNEFIKFFWVFLKQILFYFLLTCIVLINIVLTYDLRRKNNNQVNKYVHTALNLINLAQENKNVAQKRKKLSNIF